MSQKRIAFIIIFLISFSLVPNTQFQAMEESVSENKAIDNSSLTAVDSLDNVGAQSDLALDSENNVHISYRDSTNGVLKYASFDGISWDTTVVDDSSNVGFSTSIVLDSSDHVHICYYDDTNSSLKYAYFDGESWNISVVSNMSEMSNSISLGISSDDKLHLVFYHHISYNTPNIKYAVYDGESWDISGISGGTTYGQTISLVVDSNDDVHVTFTGSGLSYGFFNGTDWQFSSAAPRGYLNAIAVADNGRIYISHSSGSSSYGHSVDIAMFDGDNWSTLPAPPYNDDQSRPSAISTDSNGNVHIAYFTGCGDYGPYGCDVRYAAYNGSDWQSYELETWVREDARSSPSDLSIVIDSEDYVHLSYKNMRYEDLMYANTIVDFDLDGVRDKFDDCLGVLGTSQHDRGGCPDTDGDGYSDPTDSWEIVDGADAFVDEPTQWVDLDGDGYGDNPEGMNADMFPQNPDWWLDLDRDGIEDSFDDDVDGDGVSNALDTWPQDPTKALDTDGDGLADFVQGKLSGELIDFEDGTHGAVGMQCADELAGFCMPDYPPWIITNNSITGSYSLEQQGWASDTGHFSISFSADTEDVVTMQVYISSFLIEQNCIPILLDGASVDYGCESEGFGYYDNITISVTEGDHVLKVYGTVLGEGNRVDNIQLPDYVTSFNQDEDDDNDGILDEHELSFDIDSPCRSDPLDANSTPDNNPVINSIENIHSVSYWWGSCEVNLDSDEDGIMDSEDSCPDSFGELGYESETPGCSSKSGDGMDSSLDKDSSLALGIGIGVIAVILLVVFFVRRSGKEFQEGPVILENELQEDNPLIETSNSPNIFSENPPENATGMLNDDGYYWIEWPIASGKWYSRAPDETVWNLFEN